MAMKLTTGKRITETSSKGNQEKWREGGRWYKLDLFGYEGLAETVASRLLEHTNLGELGFSFVPYRMEVLEVHRRQRVGCSSPDFLREGEAILTLAELFRKGVGPDWQAHVARLPNLASRVRLLSAHVDSEFLPADKRIARHLLAQIPGPDGSLRCTHEEIGASVGVSRVTVSRVLGEFDRQGWVSTGYKSLRLLDRAALERYLGENA